MTKEELKKLKEDLEKFDQDYPYYGNKNQALKQEIRIELENLEK